ncbi:MAG: 50S ribosomal protein L3 [Chitinispirillaceae bacterium]|nr:50S ribosomal protein L3 [Chitinispirillaceae bacterium]
MQGIIGRKVGMTRLFESESGKAVAVTVIQAANNVVHQVKTKEKDGYAAVQLGFGPISEKRLTKPRLGHFKKLNSTPTKVIKEFRLDNDDEKPAPGTTVGVEIFENVKLVDVIGMSKGRGHAGTIKRHHFERGRKSHGNTNVRERGSMGANTYPARVWPGLRMDGHLGASQVTARNVPVVGIDKEACLVFVNGAVPGPNKGIVFIRKKK